MAIRKGKNKSWWERWDPAKRQYSDKQLRSMVDDLSLSDARRLAQIIHDQSEKARSSYDRFQRSLGRWMRTDTVRTLGSAYREIKAMIESGSDAKALAVELKCNRRASNQVRYALGHRRGSASKARAVMLAAFLEGEPCPSDDDTLRRLLKRAS